MQQYHESIIQAQRVKLDDIPLPSDDYDSNLANIGLPLAPPSSAENYPPCLPASTLSTPAPTKSILKTHTSEAVSVANLTRRFPRPPPGPPPSAPPDLSDFECEDDELELGLKADETYKPSDTSKKLRFGVTETVDSATSSSTAKLVPKSIPLHPPPPPQPPPHSSAAVSQPPPSKSAQYGVSGYQHQHAPPPPPSVSVHSAQNTNSQYTRIQQLANNRQQQQQQQQHSASSSHNYQPATTTIEAKPVLRNKAAESTKFVPISLLVKRDPLKKPEQASHNTSSSNKFYDNYQQPRQVSSYHNHYPASNSHKEYASSSSNTNATKSADADYEKFMNEIGKIL